MGADKLILWDYRRNGHIIEFPEAEGSIDVSKDGKYFAFSNLDDQIEVWSVSPLKKHAQVSAKNTNVIRFLNDGRYLAWNECDDEYESCYGFNVYELSSLSIIKKNKFQKDIRDFTSLDNSIIVGCPEELVIFPIDGQGKRKIRLNGINILRLSVTKDKHLAIYHDVLERASIRNKGSILVLDSKNHQVIEQTDIRFLDFYKDLFLVNGSVEETRALIRAKAEHDQLNQWYNVDGKIQTDVPPQTDVTDYLSSDGWIADMVGDEVTLFSYPKFVEFRRVGSEAPAEIERIMVEGGKYLFYSFQSRESYSRAKRVLVWDLETLRPIRYIDNLSEFTIDPTTGTVYGVTDKLLENNLRVFPMSSRAQILEIPFLVDKVCFGNSTLMFSDFRTLNNIVIDTQWTQSAAKVSSFDATYSFCKELAHIGGGLFGSLMVRNEIEQTDVVLVETKDNVIELSNIYQAKNTYLHSLQYDSTHSVISWIDDGKFIVLYDRLKEKVVRRIYPVNKSFISAYTFVSGGRLVVAEGTELYLIDYQSGTLLESLTVNDFIHTLTFIPSLEKLGAGTYSGKVLMIDCEHFQEQLTLFSWDAREYCVSTPSGYFKGSRDISRFISIFKGDEVLMGKPAEREYYRPDKVLQVWGTLSEAMSKVYGKTYGSDSVTRMDEEITLKTNFDLLPLHTWDKDIRLRASCTGGRRLIVRVNDNLVWGVAGKLLVSNDISEKIELTPGSNLIQCHCESDNGAKSGIETIEIFSEHMSNEKSKLFFIGLWASEFANSDYDLEYPKKDILKLHQALQSIAKTNNMVFEYDTLSGGNINAGNLRRIREKLMNSKPHDLVFMHYSGHGLLDKNLDFYLSTYHTDFDEPAKGSLLYNDFEMLLDAVPSRKKLVTIDACNSGEVQNKIIHNSVGVTTRGAFPEIAPEEEFYSDFMDEFYANSIRNSGNFILAATARDNVAQESGKWENGLFTFALLKALNEKSSDLNEDGQLAVSELKEAVSQIVWKESGYSQFPSAKSESVLNDFTIRVFEEK